MLQFSYILSLIFSLHGYHVKAYSDIHPFGQTKKEL